mgnify:CR=1 FL=1
MGFKPCKKLTQLAPFSQRGLNWIGLAIKCLLAFVLVTQHKVIVTWIWLQNKQRCSVKNLSCLFNYVNISVHPEWYERDASGKMLSPYDWTDVAKLNFNSKPMRSAMTEAMKHWVTKYDIDGFRCDVAFLVPVDFWNENRKALEKIKKVFSSL